MTAYGGGGEMTTDEREELEMDIDRESMTKINKLFNLTFYVCMYTPVGKTFIACAVVVSTMLIVGMTYGTLTDDNFKYMLSVGWIDIVTIVVMTVTFVGSSMRKKAFTAASVPVLILHGIRVLFKKPLIPFDVLTIIITIVQTCLQIACLRQYGELKRLKGQPGYPDFNGIFFADRLRKRLATDDQIRVAEELGGLAEMEVMEVTEADSSTLADKTAEPPQTECVIEIVEEVDTGIDEEEYRDIRHDMSIFD